MPIAINRPATLNTPTGLLGYEHFQLAYVTNDLDRAMAQFRDNMGIHNWTILPNPGTMRIGLAWLNGMQYELIETEGDHQPLYDDWIDKSGDYVLRHHHYGYFVHSDEEWAQLNRQIDALERKRWMDAEVETLKVIYVYSPELGHFLEYIYPNESGKAFFEGIANN